jgi:hypothetical protein
MTLKFAYYIHPNLKQQIAWCYYIRFESLCKKTKASVICLCMPPCCLVIYAQYLVKFGEKLSERKRERIASMLNRILHLSLSLYVRQSRQAPKARINGTWCSVLIALSLALTCYTAESCTVVKYTVLYTNYTVENDCSSFSSLLISKKNVTFYVNW